MDNIITDWRFWAFVGGLISILSKMYWTLFSHSKMFNGEFSRLPKELAVLSEKIATLGEDFRFLRDGMEKQREENAAGLRRLWQKVGD